LAAGAKAAWIQAVYQNLELATSALRGASRAYDHKPWGLSVCDDCGIVPNKGPFHLGLCRTFNWVSYLSGTDFILPERYWEGVFHKDFQLFYGVYTPQLLRNRLKIEQELWDYARSHRRGEGPQAQLAFVQGNKSVYQGFCRWSEDDDYPGLQYDPVHSGWHYLSELLPDLNFSFYYPLHRPASGEFWVTGTPFGKIDIVPAIADLSALTRYKALFFPGWNTITNEMYAKLADYVRGGGILVMALPQLTVEPPPQTEPSLLGGGNFADLFGVNIKSKREAVSLLKPAPDTKEHWAVDRGHTWNVQPRYGDKPLFAYSVEMKGARPVLVDQGRPVLVENTLGSGTALLMLLSNHPGRQELAPLYRDLVRRLAEHLQPEIRMEGSNTLNYSIFTDTCEGSSFTRLLCCEANWWDQHSLQTDARLIVNGRVCPITVPREKIKEVILMDHLVAASDDPALSLWSIHGKGKEYIITLQGINRRSLDLYMLSGEELVFQAANGVDLSRGEQMLDTGVRHYTLELTIPGRTTVTVRFR
jgi:hypothetical protein